MVGVVMKVCNWPFAVFGDVENCANSMAALWRLAVVRHRYFSAMLMAADGQLQTFMTTPTIYISAVLFAFSC
jgi:hypothetical protein